MNISKSSKDRLICNHFQIPCDETNLVLRAANLFRQKTNSKHCFTFELDKKIPIQAGLGGGSSNAATTLWGMNQITGLYIDNDTLASWGAELGSDVPFFFSRGTAYCEGKGEKLTSLKSIQSQKKMWIAKPKEGLSTPLVYQNVRLELLQKRDPEKALQSHFTKAPMYFNDLEISAFSLLPMLSLLKEQILQLGFESVTMTGSGTAFFCFGDVDDPKLPEIIFYSVEFINTDLSNKLNWY